MDIASGKAVRRLHGAKSTSPDPDFIPVVEGQQALITKGPDGKAKTAIQLIRVFFYCSLTKIIHAAVPGLIQGVA